MKRVFAIGILALIASALAAQVTYARAPKICHLSWGEIKNLYNGGGHDPRCL